ncbi:DNA alkylation repair protein [Acetobacterium paludosum]|uniref:DNA alkylation repair protein n=1 Tax=Acetobacterium paludosum TaxID=52693 RepID=A0A923KR40_9FIRM|nr:DNA alkylation repair protein [Acetobacterium paludosum]MBC3886852.1 DNA alkylation repair protein [Acetobacterium paludosum]
MEITGASVKKELLDLRDEQYQKFSRSLLPGTDNVIGVRLPVLRKLAKEIIKKDWENYLNTAEDEYFEEVMLQGIVIGLVDVSLDRRFSLIADFMPKINNWSTCDSFITGLKFTKKNEKEVWQFLQPFFQSRRTYEIRFGVVMINSYFVKPGYIKSAFAIFDDLNHEDYYVKMAVAWAISTFYIHYPNETRDYLHNNKLDAFTFNKALQKITESRRIDSDTKTMIRGLKRKNCN